MNNICEWKHKEKESFAHFMVTFVPKSLALGIATLGVMYIVYLGLSAFWYSVTCASPVGCWP